MPDGQSRRGACNRPQASPPDFAPESRRPVQAAHEIPSGRLEDALAPRYQDAYHKNFLGTLREALPPNSGTTTQPKI